MLKQTMRLMMLPAAAAVLVACGGGGGSPTASLNSFGGTAAVGAPLRAATIEVFDLQGQRIAQTQTDESGKYQIQLPSGAQGPFIIKAIYADEALFSVYSGQGGVANISHLTDAVTAILSPSGAADGFVLNAGRASDLAPAKIAEAMAKIQAAVSPVTSAISDIPSGANFLNSAFEANGTGIDRLLDAATVSVTSSSQNNQGASNISVGFNVGQGGNQLNSANFVNFTSTQSQNDIQNAVRNFSFTSSQLPPSNIGTLYNDLIDRLNSCYAIPRGSRTQGNEVVNPICKSVFYQARPELYKDGGFNVRERFVSLFESTRQIRFSPTFSPIIMQDFVGNNPSGRALVAAKGEDDLGNYSYNRFYVKKYTLNGREVLGVEGDQNPFEFFVNAENEHRTFVNSSLDLDFLQSQFALILRPTSNQLPLITAAVVEGPAGKFLMAPVVGRDSFRICNFISETPAEIRTRPINCTKAPLLIYASQFVNPGARPRGVNTPLDFDFIKRDFLKALDSDGNPFSDFSIRSIPNGALWKATVYDRNGGKTEIFTRNTGRPMDSTELTGADGPMNRAAKFSKLTMAEDNSSSRVVDFNVPRPLRANAGMPAFSSSRPRTTDLITNRTPAWAPMVGGFKFEWTVTPGQIPPFVTFLSGQVPFEWTGPYISNSVERQPFEELKRFSTGSRNTEIFCSPTGSLSNPEDKSCDVNLNSENNPVDYIRQNGNFVFNPGAWMTSTSLISRDQQQRSIIRVYNWFIPTAGGPSNFIE